MPRRIVFSRLTGWIFSWKTLRRSLVALAGLITLIALLVTEENWRGKRAWEHFKQEWEARGERFDLASFLPKPVPDEQNFVMTPLFAPVIESEKGMAASGNLDTTNFLRSSLDIYGGANDKSAPMFGNLRKGDLTDLQAWQKFYGAKTNFPSASQSQSPAKDVLQALDRFRPVLTELRNARRRPYAQFPQYPDRDPMLPLFHPGNLQSIAPVVRLRATAFLADGQGHEALEDVRLCLRLADSLKQEPFLITHLVRLSILEASINTVWEGLSRHQWGEPELMELQRLLSAMDLLTDYEVVIRGERALSNALMSGMRADHRVTAGLFFQNQLNINRLYQLRMLPLIDARQRRVFPVPSGQLANPSEFKKHNLYNVLARMLIPAIGKNAIKTARSQVILDLASIACALERFRLANGAYPENLQALVPCFIEKIPDDIINGKALQYRRTEDGRFVLYSVGWNQKDDDGAIVFNKGRTSTENDEQGDWVWRYPVGK